MSIFSDYLYVDFLSHYGTYFSALMKLCERNRQDAQRSLRNSFARMSTVRFGKITNDRIMKEHFLIFQTTFLKYVEPCSIQLGELVQG